MILEAAQLINTNLWIDHLFGFVPRAITKEENKVLQEIIAIKRQNPYSEDKSIELFDGLYHEIMREPEKEEFFKTLTTWISERV